MERTKKLFGLRHYPRDGMTQYAGNWSEWARLEVNAIRVAKGMKPMLLTDFAVRRKGENVAIRYCVMCLADDEKKPAVCLIDIGDGDVQAGYCAECSVTMQNCGHRDVKPLPAGENGTAVAGKGRGLTIKTGRRSKLTDAQRAEIAESPDTQSVLAKQYGVSEQTIYQVRRKAREAAPAAPEAPAAVEVVLADVPVADVNRRLDEMAEIGARYAERQERNKVYATPPEPMSREQEAPRRITAEEDAPATVAITLDLTHETANAIWGGLSLEEKATFCRTKIIERLELMA